MPVQSATDARGQRVTLPEILREAAKGAPETYKDLLESGAHRIDQLERLQDEDRKARKRHWYEKRRMERCFNKALLEQEALLKEAADALEDTSDIGARIRTRLYELAQPFVRSDSFNPALRCNERGEWVEKEGSDALTE